MSVKKINTVRYQCKCNHPDCAHEWESDSIPDRCASCKQRTWNRTALRVGRVGNQIIAFSKSQTIAEWGREYKISAATIAARIRHEWTVEDAIATPVQKKQESVKEI